MTGGLWSRSQTAWSSSKAGHFTPLRAAIRTTFPGRRRKKTQDVPRESAPKAASEGYRSKEERAREAQRRNRVRAIEQELAALEGEDAALSEELLTCGRDYVRAQQIAARQTEIAAKSDALYEEYGTLID